MKLFTILKYNLFIIKTFFLSNILHGSHLEKKKIKKNQSVINQYNFKS